MGQILKKMIGSETDLQTINKLLRMLLQLDSVMCNAIFDLNKELKGGNVLRQEIKKNINEIRKKLKTNVKGDWDKLDSDFVDNFVENAERFEQMCYNFFRLGEGMFISIPLKFKTNDKVWTMREGKETLCIVKSVEINMIAKEEILEDKSFYVLQVLDKNGKETTEIIHVGEEEIFAHKKDMRNENSKI